MFLFCSFNDIAKTSRVQFQENFKAYEIKLTVAGQSGA